MLTRMFRDFSSRMKNLAPKALALSLLTLATLASGVRANDGIYPPAPAAANVINFDGKGFLIHGQREFLASGSLHYARVPRELWKDRLLKIKRAGFNTVQTYVFWNYHEPQQGQFDFTSTEHDLGAFLQAAQDVGLYAVVRVGPYDCAEWDSGGFPVWLRNVPDLKVRDDNPAFLAAVDKFWDKLLPIVAAHQIHKGGNVIMVQLENEDPQGWGTEFSDKPYHAHLQKKALELGLEVPYFFSGLHHGTDTGGWKVVDSSNRANPWYATETWIRWFDKYGASDIGALNDYTRNIWNVIANGGNGFNLYMIHGGTDFDYFNADNSAASYDYGAMIGEAGDLRNLYYTVRRGGIFATSFPEILENSTNSDSEFASFSSSPGGAGGNANSPIVHPYSRKAPAGTIVFLRNSAKAEQDATLASGQVVKLDALEVAPMLIDTTLAPGIRAKLAAVRTLGRATHGSTTTWIVYGKPEEKAHIDLDLDAAATIAPGASTTAFQTNVTDAKKPAIDLAFSEDGPQELTLTAGGQTLRLISMTPAWTNRTWIVGERGAQTVVTGPDYVGDFAETNGKANLTVARNFGNPALKQITLSGEGATRTVAVNDPVTADSETAPTLSAWEAAPGDAQAGPDFRDTGWITSQKPQPLGADNDASAYGWYRASFTSPVAGQGKLNASIYDHAVVYLNGALVGPTKARDGVTLDVKPGTNLLAIFASHKGRPTGYNYVKGPLSDYYSKGVLGSVTVTIGGQTIPVTGWKLHGGIFAIDSPKLKWTPAPAANTGAPTFFRTQFEAKAPTASGPVAILRMSTKGLTRGSIWLNGRNLGRYPQIIKVDGLYLPETWLKDGPNSLVVFDEEGHVPTADTKLWLEKASSREVFQIQE